MSILSFMVRKTIDSDDYNLARDEFELALLKKPSSEQTNLGNLPWCSAC